MPTPFSESIWISRNNRCGGWERMASSAERLSPYSPMIRRSGSRTQHSRSVRRAVGSSSTMMTSSVSGMLRRHELRPVTQQRHANLRNPVAGACGLRGECGAFRELHGQALAHVAQSDAVAAYDRVRCDRVDYAQYQVLATYTDFNPDLHGAVVTREPVDDGILDERLQNQA